MCLPEQFEINRQVTVFGYATFFFPINRCPISVITFWIKEAQSGGIEGHTPTLERFLGGRPKRHFRATRRKFRAQGRAALS